MVKDKALLTPEEVQWFIDNYYLEMKNMVGPKTNIIVDGVKMSKMDELMSRLIPAFAEAFPYRNPATNQRRIPTQMCKLQYRADEWPGVLRMHLWNKLNHLRHKERGKFDLSNMPGAEMSESKGEDTITGDEEDEEEEGQSEVGDDGDDDDKDGDEETDSEENKEGEEGDKRECSEEEGADHDGGDDQQWD
ncbi:hypothetical protein FRC11_008989 [Ceratobasidium sp. 423]|nr:hypothetical protein FRC11_008989 [Ceratobasidium sp. 423]